MGDGPYTQTRGRCWTLFLMSTFQIQPSFRYVHTSPLRFVIRDDIPDPFSPGEFEVAFRSFKMGKSPGLDGIGMEVLQNLDGMSLGRLAVMYNMSPALGYAFPERWRGSRPFSFPRWERGITLHRRTF